MGVGQNAAGRHRGASRGHHRINGSLRPIAVVCMEVKEIRKKMGDAEFISQAGALKRDISCKVDRAEKQAKRLVRMHHASKED